MGRFQHCRMSVLRISGPVGIECDIRNLDRSKNSKLEIKMKQNNTCPKCNSQQIILIPGELGGAGAGNIIPIGITLFNTVKVTRYMCSDCGYSEEWIDNPKDLKKLKANLAQKLTNPTFR